MERDYYKVSKHGPHGPEVQAHGLTRKGAYRKADQLDQDYGASIHSVQRMTPGADPWFNKWTNEQRQEAAMQKAMTESQTPAQSPMPQQMNPSAAESPPSSMPGVAKALPMMR